MSYTMQTNLHLVARTLPSEYRKKLEVEFGEAFADTDEVPDVPVEVEYDGGWYEPAKLTGPWEDCYPSSGDDPEITSILIDGIHEILSEVPANDLTDLIARCWEDQQDYRD